VAVGQKGAGQRVEAGQVSSCGSVQFGSQVAVQLWDCSSPLSVRGPVRETLMGNSDSTAAGSIRGGSFGDLRQPSGSSVPVSLVPHCSGGSSAQSVACSLVGEAANDATSSAMVRSDPVGETQAVATPTGTIADLRDRDDGLGVHATDVQRDPPLATPSHVSASAHHHMRLVSLHRRGRERVETWIDQSGL
jgi:hypothetical protein